MYYYAEIDGDCKVIATHPVTEQSTNANYVEITEEQYATGVVLNTYYNKLTGAFEAVDPNMWMGDTEWIRISGTGSGATGKRLSTELENMKYDLAHKADAESIPTSLPANGGNADTVDGKHATDFATAGHNHDSDYADADHNHDSDYAGATHSHAQSDITGLATALNGKANATHTHSEYVTNEDFSELETAVNGKANASHTHSQYANANDVAELQNEVDGKADANHSHSEYAAANHSHNGYAAASHTHSQYANATDVEALEDEVAGKANANHTHTQYAASSHTHDNYVTNDTYTSGMGGKANASHTHAQTDITGLSDALSSKANINHAHDYIAKALQFTTDIGGMEKTFYVEDNTNLITELEALSMGFHTVYSQAGIEGNPNATESWRCLLHKPSSNIMWVLAFGTTGAICTNYWNGGVWHGWREVYSTGKIPTAAEVGAASAVVYGGNGANTYKKVWISTTGSDDNAGTTSAPMATITGAIRKYSEKHKMLDISLADGVYNEDLGAVSPALVNLAIRSNSENKDAVTINMTNTFEINVPIVRLYNITLSVAETGVRPISVTGGRFYANNVRINVSENSGSSCVNVYNGCDAFLMNCVLNSGISGSGAGVYGNQGGLIKVINCTSERTVAIGVYATNGTNIEYTDTITATTKAKTATWGKCTLR